MSNSQWSQALQQQTLECISEGIFNPLDGNLHFKHIDGRYASMTAHCLLNGTLRLTDKDSGETISFETAESLVEAGWAVD